MRAAVDTNVLVSALLRPQGLAGQILRLLVPQRFSKEIGVITGIVGAAGGLGGFFLPNLLGSLKQLSGSFAGSFLIFGLVGFGCAAALYYVGRSWEGAFVGEGGLAATADVNEPVTPAVPGFIPAEVEATA